MTPAHPADHIPIIKVSDLAYERDGRQILRDASFTVMHHDFVAITGPNGGGKTTLLRLLLKLVKPTRGVVEYYDAAGTPTSHLKIGYLPQKSAIDAHFPISALEVVESGLLNDKSVDGAERARRAIAALESVGLGDRLRQAIGTLSGGQLQRALFARAVVSDPQLLVLDEPLSYLDRKYEERLYELLEEMSPRRTVLIVTHELSIVDRMANLHLIVDGTVSACPAASHGPAVTPCH